MNDDVISQQIKKYSDFISFFPTLVISENMVSEIKANTVYISCKFKDIIESSFDMDYVIPNDVKEEYGNKPNNINGIHLFSENSKKKSRRSEERNYIGTFVPEFNSIILERNIFYEKNAGDIIKSIMDSTKKIRDQEKELIKHNIKLDKKIQIIFGNRVYNHHITKIENRKLWHLKELLSSSGEHSLVMLGNNIFKLGKYSSSDLVQESKIDEIAERAMVNIDEIKRNYINQLNKIKETYSRKFEENIPIPDISFEDIVTNKLMISRYKEGVCYSFIVDINVDMALNEDTKKYVKLDPPYLYKNNILTFRIDIDNILKRIVLYDETGKNISKHLQINSQHEVCTGSLKVIGKKFKSFKEILELKNKLIVLLSTFNTDSCRHSYPYSEICNKLYKSGFSITGKKGIMLNPRENKKSEEMVHNVPDG